MSKLFFMDRVGLEKRITWGGWFTFYQGAGEITAKKLEYRKKNR